VRLLVTGGCGFIGANFIHYVFERFGDPYVVNLDKLTYAGNPLSVRPVEEAHGGERYFFVHGDIADPEVCRSILAQHDIQAVVNFAAESHVDRSISDPSPFVTTNVLGTQTLLDAAMEHGVERFVHISPDEVYKASADLLARAYHRTYGFPVVVTRCSNNYGPFQFPEKLIPLMIAKARAGEPLPVYGDGLQVRDWIHVRDHCRGVELALRKGRPGAVYNLGGNAEKTNLDRPESLIRHVADRPGHDRRYAMDYSLAQGELGFEPDKDFDQALLDTIRWYHDNQAWVAGVVSGEYLRFMDQWYGDRQ
jgi:dTDP-glucose 4,6-dehydratase